MWGLACFAFAFSLKFWGLVSGREVGRMWLSAATPALLQFSHSQSSSLWEPSRVFLLCPGGEARPAAPLPSRPD